jgi:voltage-gated potassium channel
VIGFVLALILLALAVALVPLRFSRAIRSGVRDPEFRPLCALVGLTLAAGTIFYREVEGWSVLDSFYLSAFTLATVGYGDLTASTPGGKLFTVFYVFAGVGIIFAFVEAVARASVAKRDESRTLLDRRSRNDWRNGEEEDPE